MPLHSSEIQLLAPKKERNRIYYPFYCENKPAKRMSKIQGQEKPFYSKVLQTNTHELTLIPVCTYILTHKHIYIPGPHTICHENKPKLFHPLDNYDYYKSWKKLS